LSSAASTDSENDEAFTLLELGLTDEEKRALKVVEIPAVSRVKAQEWMDTDDFLWSPTGQ
jgi:hypothetical protein